MATFHDADPDAVPGYVLRFFDGLARERVDAECVVRRTADWLGRTVVARVGATVITGRRAQDRLDVSHEVADSIVVDGLHLTLAPPAGPDDRAVLDRLGACLLLMLAGVDGQRMSEARALDALILSDTAVDTRRRAQQLLGLAADAEITVLVAAGPASGIGALCDALTRAGVRVHTSRHARTTVILGVGPHIGARLQEGVPRDVQVAISNRHRLADAAEALREARAAFRFSQPSQRDHGPYLLEEGVGFEYWRLRGYEALAEGMHPALIDRMQDVQALDRVLATNGPEMLRTLDVAVAAPSVRHAARVLDVHHNTVAHRVSTAEAVFGYSLTDSYGRSRLFLAITLRRIRQSHGLL